MGITGLLPLLRSIHRQRHLKDFAPKTLGVDGYAWLHRGVNSCATELVQGLPCRAYVNSFLHRVRMLIHFGVVPFIVFDGDNLPSKAGTEQARAARRQEEAAKGMRLLNAGRRAEAAIAMQKAVDVTPVMAREVIEELKKLKVQYVVAPYEADAQLVYLERIGVIDGILADDSDMLVFGTKCLVTKVDQYGNCEEINRSDFGSCSEISIAGWTDDQFRSMCILSGCDYLPSPGRIGLKTAYQLIRRYKTIDRVVKAILLDSKYKVPRDYLESYYKAERTFLHQRVFCPKQKKLVMFTEPDEELSPEVLAVIGDDVAAEIAVEIASGNLHPTTKEKISLSRIPGQRQSWPLKQAVRHPAVETPKPKSFDNFFKPKRTPLAELDINSFTPSPSQRLLQSAPPASWPAVPITSVTPVPAQRAGGSVTQATPIINRTSRTPSQLSQSSSKKRRLCSEIEADTSEVLLSPFFSKNISTISSAKKAKTVEIWSDVTTSQIPTTSDVQKEKNENGTASITKEEVTLEAEAISLDVPLVSKSPPRSRIPVPVGKVASESSTLKSRNLSSFSLGPAPAPSKPNAVAKLSKGHVRQISTSQKPTPSLQRQTSSFRQLPTPSLSRETSRSTSDASQRLNEGSISKKTSQTKHTTPLVPLARRQSDMLSTGTVVNQDVQQSIAAPVVCGSEDLLEYIDENREDSETLASFRRFMYKG